jgi:hypothetical protein
MLNRLPSSPSALMSNIDNLSLYCHPRACRDPVNKKFKLVLTKPSTTVLDNWFAVISIVKMHFIVVFIAIHFILEISKY